MQAKELRKKETTDLQEVLEDLFDEKLKLNLQGRGQQTKHSHRFKEIARDIARVKTILRERV